VYDLIITGGTIVDGTGAASFRGDLAIEVAPMLAEPRGEFETGDLEDMRLLAETAARPVMFAPVRHVPSYPGRANFILSETSKIMAREGLRLFPQIGFRPMEMHLSWHKLLPLFASLPTWRKVMFLPAHKIPAARCVIP
jgi:hypothetical protein